MRLNKQWFFSLLLFSATSAFLFYSSDFFSPTAPALSNPMQQSSVPQCNLVLLANQEYYPYLKEHFRKARKSIVGTVYLFKTAPYRDNEPADLLRELIAAQKRNVEVQLVLDLSNQERALKEANLRAAELLKQAGVSVRLDRPEIATHAKTFVIDDRYCFVGSHNFTHAAMATNRELSMFIDSPDLAKRIRAFIKQIPTSQ